ncbi:MAG: carotenoid 1,2-hydratase [Gammaproteobacteria bacterium]|nr:carotenoid 1,2-hydratase [Gammaproteobacteria bacterium]
MNRRHWLALAGIPLSAWLLRRAPTSSTDSPITAVLAERDLDPEFDRARERRTFAFPRDHGPHPTYRHEWWYFTGNLGSEAGAAFGFQLTFFRFAVAAQARTVESAWSSPQILLGHFALTDLKAQRFMQFERISREALGIAGASLKPPAVWINDWRSALTAPVRHGWQLRAAEDGCALRLDVASNASPVLQGDDGLSQKGSDLGNASYYYSVPYLTAVGDVQIGAVKHKVQGRAWLDREWGTSALAPDQVGWDWFGLQFDDGSSLMFYCLRLRTGARDPHSAGTWVGADGRVHKLDAASTKIAITREWTSPITGIAYPARWRIGIASLDVKIEVIPRLADQEWRGRFRYWEGAVTVTGSRGSSPLAGFGYVELAGYA